MPDTDSHTAEASPDPSTLPSTAPVSVCVSAAPAPDAPASTPSDPAQSTPAIATTAADTADAATPSISGVASVSGGSAIEATSEPGEADEFEIVDGYDTGSLSDTGSSTGSTSATSSVYAHTYEKGRRYHHFKNSRYPLPDDDLEQNREDMKHAMMLELCDGRLFYAPIGDHPQLILDVGTGTGIWAIEMGDKFPSAHVRGIDITPIQPVWVPPNVTFLVDDYTQPWLARDVDFVHFRFVALIMENPSRVLSNCFESLRPGGWVELQELHCEIFCDDGTLPEDDPLKYTYKLAHEAFLKFNMNIRIARHLGTLLREAGFTNIQCVAKKVPIGVWAKDKSLRLIGLYQKIAVADILPAFASRPFDALGVPQVESQVIMARARQGLEDTSVHRYFMYYFWYAQKPENAG